MPLTFDGARQVGSQSQERPGILPASMLRGAWKLFGVVPLAQNPPARGRRHAENAVDRRLIPSNIELPLYVRDGVDAYMLAHEASTFRTVVMQGLKALGIAVENEDLVPERAMRKPRKRDTEEDDTPATLKATTLRVPRYVRLRAEEYLLDHPEMRFRHLVMAGLKKLGIKVNKEDLVAGRHNVLAAAPVRRGA
jgi:hypothetical protein